MRRSLPLLLAGVIASAVLAPAGAAHADADSVSTYLAELTAAKVPSEAASLEGWTVTYDFTPPRGRRQVNEFALNPTNGRFRSVSYEGAAAIDWEVQVSKVGTYTSPVGQDAVGKQALGLLRKPRAWVLRPDAKLDALDEASSEAPTTLLDDLKPTGGDTITSITRTDAPDGSRTYVETGTDSDGPLTVTYVINSAGALVSGVAASEGHDLGSVSITYGAPAIALPARTNVVAASAYARAREAVKLPATLSQAAALVVTRAKASAARAHRTALRPADLSNGVAALVQSQKSALIKITATAKPGGYALTATNPYTKRRLVKLVRIVNGKAVVS